MTFIYAITCEGFVKIGRSVAPEVRLAQFRGACPFHLTLAGYEAGGHEREARLHEKFDADRVRGEWFKITPSIQKWIDGLSAPAQPNAYPERVGPRYEAGAA